jgi:hypothetical protein
MDDTIIPEAYLYERTLQNSFESVQKDDH